MNSASPNHLLIICIFYPLYKFCERSRNVSVIYPCRPSDSTQQDPTNCNMSITPQSVLCEQTTNCWRMPAGLAASVVLRIATTACLPSLVFLSGCEEKIFIAPSVLHRRPWDLVYPWLQGAGGLISPLNPRLTLLYAFPKAQDLILVLSSLDWDLSPIPLTTTKCECWFDDLQSSFHCGHYCPWLDKTRFNSV